MPAVRAVFRFSRGRERLLPVPRRLLPRALSSHDGEGCRVERALREFHSSRSGVLRRVLPFVRRDRRNARLHERHDARRSASEKELLAGGRRGTDRCGGLRDTHVLWVQRSVFSRTSWRTFGDIRVLAGAPQSSRKRSTAASTNRVAWGRETARTAGATACVVTGTKVRSATCAKKTIIFRPPSSDAASAGRSHLRASSPSCCWRQHRCWRSLRSPSSIPAS